MHSSPLSTNKQQISREYQQQCKQNQSLVVNITTGSPNNFSLILFFFFHVFPQKYKEYEKDVAIEEIDGLQLVKKLAKNMEEMFHKKSEAVRVSSRAVCYFILLCQTKHGIWALLWKMYKQLKMKWKH